MTALKHPSPVSVADYLAGEEIADVKHEYLGGVIHAMAGGNARHSAISTSAAGTLKQLILIEPDEARVIVYRRKATGGFEAEEHLGLDAVISLPEIEAALPLAELYERVTF